MEIKKLSNEYFVSPQITVDDLEALKEIGIKSIICNRPDGEAETQPSYREIETKAAEFGIEFSYIPVLKAPATDIEVNSFSEIFSDLPKPALAYCRSGMRSTTIWAIDNPSKLSVSEILQTASNAGYDLTEHLSKK